MTKNKDPNKESLVDIAVDPDILARELALEIEIDPLEQIDEDSFPKGLDITQECNEALNIQNLPFDQYLLRIAYSLQLYFRYRNFLHLVL